MLSNAPEWSGTEITGICHTAIGLMARPINPKEKEGHNFYVEKHFLL
jgi:hypothetical protein